MRRGGESLKNKKHRTHRQTVDNTENQHKSSHHSFSRCFSSILFRISFSLESTFLIDVHISHAYSFPANIYHFYARIYSFRSSINAFASIFIFLVHFIYTDFTLFILLFLHTRVLSNNSSFKTHFSLNGKTPLSEMGMGCMVMPSMKETRNFFWKWKSPEKCATDSFSVCFPLTLSFSVAIVRLTWSQISQNKRDSISCAMESIRNRRNHDTAMG